MALRFNKTKAGNPGARSKLKPVKGKWAPLSLPQGRLTGLFNGFSRAYSDSLREIYLSSQVANPICQADVDSALAPMAAMVEQSIELEQAAHLAFVCQASQLLDELDMTKNELAHCWELVETPPSKAEMPALQPGQTAQALPKNGSGHAGDDAGHKAQPRPASDADADLKKKQDTPSATPLQYAEAAHKEMAAKSNGVTHGK